VIGAHIHKSQIKHSEQKQYDCLTIVLYIGGIVRFCTSVCSDAKKRGNANNFYKLFPGQE